MGPFSNETSGQVSLTKRIRKQQSRGHLEEEREDY